jgi:excisionase family DNA binding protein
MQLLLPIKQAASDLGVGRTKLYELVNQHELELVKIGSKSLITASSLNALVARLTEAKGGNPDANAIDAQKSRGQVSA